MDTGITVITPDGIGITCKLHPYGNQNRIAVRLVSGPILYYFITELKFC